MVNKRRKCLHIMERLPTQPLVGNMVHNSDTIHRFWHIQTNKNNKENPRGYTDSSGSRRIHICTFIPKATVGDRQHLTPNGHRFSCHSGWTSNHLGSITDRFGIPSVAACPRRHNNTGRQRVLHGNCGSHRCLRHLDSRMQTKGPSPHRRFSRYRIRRPIDVSGNVGSACICFSHSRRFP